MLDPEKPATVGASASARWLTFSVQNDGEKSPTLSAVRLGSGHPQVLQMQSGVPVSRVSSRHLADLPGPSVHCCACLVNRSVHVSCCLGAQTSRGKWEEERKKKTPQSLSHTTWMHWPLMKLPMLDMNSFPYRIFKSGWRYQMWQQLPKIKYQTDKHVTAQESSIFHAVVSGRTLPSFFFLFFFQHGNVFL